MINLTGFAPDADPTTQGVVTACWNMVPAQIGLTGAPVGQTPTDVPALAAECQGAVVATKLDASRRVIAGTQTKLYELAGGSWSDVSKAGNYVGAAEGRWSFTQFGDATLAANGVEAIQRSTSGAFASIAGAPIADIVFSVGAFVMALATNDGTYGDQPDRWWCCASYDDTSWTPSLTTLATTGRFVSAPGPILAGGRLGEYAIAYKQKAIYVGRYVGTPGVWDFIQAPGSEAGCVGIEAFCSIGAAHFIVGTDNFYLFDGTAPQAVGVGVVRDWFFNNVNPTYLYKVKCSYDRKTNTVWVFYPSVGSTKCDRAIVYHVATQQWGFVIQSVEAVIDYISSGQTINGMDTVSATIDGLTEYAFDSQFWLAGSRSLSIVNTSHQLQMMTGQTVTSGFTTGDIGDDETVSLLRKIRLRYAPGFGPTTSVQCYSKQVAGDGLTTGPTATMSDGKLDVLQAARYHRLDFTFTGPVKVISIGLDTKPGSGH